jgi:hypothetical protein
MKQFKIANLRNRIIETPVSIIEPVIDYEGLSDEEKLLVYLLAYWYKDYAVTKKHIMQKFWWTSYRVTKLRKTINELYMNINIDVVPIFDQGNGKLNGNGYLLDIISL